MLEPRADRLEARDILSHRSVDQFVAVYVSSFAHPFDRGTPVVGADDLEFLASLPNLTHVYLMDVILQAGALAPLCRCPKLAELHINGPACRSAAFDRCGTTN